MKQAVSGRTPEVFTLLFYLFMSLPTVKGRAPTDRSQSLKWDNSSALSFRKSGTTG